MMCNGVHTVIALLLFFSAFYTSTKLLISFLAHCRQPKDYKINLAEKDPVPSEQTAVNPTHLPVYSLNST